MSSIKKSANGNLSIDDIQLRFVKEFLDIIMLFELKEHKELSGYDLAVLQNQKFEISLSPGTVYATLYSMERRNLIVGKSNGNKTTFTLTDKGDEALKNIKRSGEAISEFLCGIFPSYDRPSDAKT